MKDRRYLWWALAISVLVHAIFALLLHHKRVSPLSGIARITIAARPYITSVTHQRPPPTPPPTPHPRASRAPRIHPVHLNAKRGLQRTARAPQARQVPSPRPAIRPSPTPPPGGLACVRRSIPAKILVEPSAPPIDPVTRAAQKSGIATIAVTLGKRGNFRNAVIQGSSGSTALDVLALQMARSAQYAPATQNCRPIIGALLFRVKFVAW